MSIRDIPALNAILNATSAVFLVFGFVFIRRKNVSAHRACMLSAFALSVMFLVSYVVYHAGAGSTAFRGRGIIRPVYFTILVSHVILAAGIVPLAAVTLARGFRGRIESHRRIARCTLPLWLYVSVTGVVIYWMLYHAYAADPPLPPSAWSR